MPAQRRGREHCAHAYEDSRRRRTSPKAATDVLEGVNQRGPGASVGGRTDEPPLRRRATRRGARTPAARPGTEQIPRLLLTRKEAASALGVSLDTFERRVQPLIKLVPCGQLLLVPVRELERWCDEQAHHMAVASGKPRVAAPWYYTGHGLAAHEASRRIRPSFDHVPCVWGVAGAVHARIPGSPSASGNAQGR